MGLLTLGTTRTHDRGGDLRRFDTNPHQFSCGIDRHARSMDVCLVSHEGDIVLHRTMQAGPDPLLQAVAPDREGLVVAVECLFTWSWLADRWVQEGRPCVLGPALSRRALHGGNATHDQLDAHQMATLLRGGMLPQASVSPAQMRATGDLLRRRMPLRRQRAALLAHVHKTHRQSNRPELGTNLADKATRGGVAEGFAEAAGQKNIEVDLALLTSAEELLRALDLSLLQTAQHHAAHTLYLRQTVPGMGTLLRLVRLDDIHDRARFPRGQAFVSYGRLGTCAKASAGKRWGTSGKNIGHAPLTWACSEAAAVFLRNPPHGQKDLVRLEKKPDQGKALTLRAHKLARAVYDLLQRQTALDRDLFRRSSESSAGEPAGSRDTQGNEPEASVLTGLLDGVLARQGVHLGRVALSLTG